MRWSQGHKYYSKLNSCSCLWYGTYFVTTFINVRENPRGLNINITTWAWWTQLNHFPRFQRQCFGSPHYNLIILFMLWLTLRCFTRFVVLPQNPLVPHVPYCVTVSWNWNSSTHDCTCMEPLLSTGLSERNIATQPYVAYDCDMWRKGSSNSWVSFRRDPSSYFPLCSCWLLSDTCTPYY